MNLAGFAGWQTTWSESCGLASEPLCTGFFSTLLAVRRTGHVAQLEPSELQEGQFSDCCCDPGGLARAR